MSYDGALADAGLRRGLAGLALEVADGRAITEVLTSVAGWAVEAIPNVDGASVTLHSAANDDAIESWSGTAEFVREIHILEHDVLGDGPHETCVRTQAPVMSGSLGVDQRWPKFGPRMAALEVHSTVVLPLLVAGQMIGAIAVYARARDAFNEHLVCLGAEFARPAAVSVFNARKLHALQETARQLRLALRNRAVIDQAVGLLRGRSGASADEALARLVRISETADLELAAAAHRLIEQSVHRSRMLRP